MSVSKHTAYNLAGALIPLALSFATVPLYLHLVGPDRYGVLAIAWLLLGYFGLFDLGLGRATSFRIASLKDPDGAVHADVFKTAVGINMGIGVVGGAILWLAGWWFFGSIFKVGPDLRAETLQALPWLAASVPVATMTGVLSGALQGREKFLETNTVSVISTVLFQILPLGVAWFYGPHLPGLLAAAVLARVVAIIVMWFSCHKEFTRGHSPRWRKDEARELLAFGGWVTLNSFLWPLLIMTDRFLIGGLLNARAVAVYTIPFQLAQRASVVPTAVANALFPRLASSAEDARNATFDKSVRTVAALLGPPIFIGLFVFEPFLKIWLGHDMAMAAYPIGQIVLVGIWANSLTALYYSFYQAAGRPRVVSLTLLAQVVPYLAMLWIGLRFWGLEGAAWAGVIRSYGIFLPMFLARQPSHQTRMIVAITAVGLIAGFSAVRYVYTATIVIHVGALCIFCGLTFFCIQSLRRDFPATFRQFTLKLI